MDTFVDKNVIITGATGSIGCAVLKRFLDSPEVLNSKAKIAVFVREEDRLQSTLKQEHFINWLSIKNNQRNIKLILCDMD